MNPDVGATWGQGGVVADGWPLGPVGQAEAQRFPRGAIAAHDVAPIGDDVVAHPLGVDGVAVRQQLAELGHLPCLRIPQHLRVGHRQRDRHHEDDLGRQVVEGPARFLRQADVDVVADEPAWPAVELVVGDLPVLARDRRRLRPLDAGQLVALARRVADHLDAAEGRRRRGRRQDPVPLLQSLHDQRVAAGGREGVDDVVLRCRRRIGPSGRDRIGEQQRAGPVLVDAVADRERRPHRDLDRDRPRVVDVAARHRETADRAVERRLADHHRRVFAERERPAGEFDHRAGGVRREDVQVDVGELRAVDVDARVALRVDGDVRPHLAPDLARRATAHRVVEAAAERVAADAGVLEVLDADAQQADRRKAVRALDLQVEVAVVAGGARRRLVVAELRVEHRHRPGQVGLEARPSAREAVDVQGEIRRPPA
jgi:hypothetical protein